MPRPPPQRDVGKAAPQQDANDADALLAISPEDGTRPISTVPVKRHLDLQCVFDEEPTATNTKSTVWWTGEHTRTKHKLQIKCKPGRVTYMNLHDEDKIVLQVPVGNIETYFGRPVPEQAAARQHQLVSKEATRKAFDIIYEISRKYSLDQLPIEELYPEMVNILLKEKIPCEKLPNGHRQVGGHLRCNERCTTPSAECSPTGDVRSGSSTARKGKSAERRTKTVKDEVQQDAKQEVKKEVKKEAEKEVKKDAKRHQTGCDTDKKKAKRRGVASAAKENEEAEAGKKEEPAANNRKTELGDKTESEIEQKEDSQHVTFKAKAATAPKRIRTPSGTTPNQSASNRSNGAVEANFSRSKGFGTDVMWSTC